MKFTNFLFKDTLKEIGIHSHIFVKYTNFQFNICNIRLYAKFLENRPIARCLWCSTLRQWAREKSFGKPDISFS